MHPQLRCLATILVVGVALAAGCTSTPGRMAPPAIRKVFVTDTVGALNPEGNLLCHAVHDASVRELTRLGFVAVATLHEADATLRSSWHHPSTDAAHPGVPLQALSVTLYDQAGRRLFEAQSGPMLVSQFWTEARATAEATALVRRLGQATAQK